MTVPLISVHFPKAGGTSLLNSFQQAFGRNAVLTDYQDDPCDPCSAFNLDPIGCRLDAQRVLQSQHCRVIHGHFHPAKYDFLPRARRITFLRHPIDTLLSLYFFARTIPSGHGLFTYYRSRNFSVLEMARLPVIRYMMSRTFFGGVDLDAFEFIGFMETYVQSVKELSRRFSLPIKESKKNANKFPDYHAELQNLKADRDVMTQLQNLLIDDIRLYDRLRQRRAAAAA